MSKFKFRAFIIFFIVAVSYISAPYVLPAKVVAVYQGSYPDDFNNRECWSTIVLVDNPPFTKKGMLKLWGKESSLLGDNYKILRKSCEKIYFGKNNFVRPYDNQELKYWLGDYQVCMKGTINGKCIDNDDLFMSVSFDKTLNDNQVISTYNGKKIYIQTKR